MIRFVRAARFWIESDSKTLGHRCILLCEYPELDRKGLTGYQMPGKFTV